MLTKEQSDLAIKTNYFYPARFISGRIMEYDIRAANISMLRDKNILTDDLYKFLLTCPKQYREEFVGLQIKQEKDESGSRSALDGSITYKTIYEGIRDSKLKLFELNNIQTDEVIRIANDAVFVNRVGNLKNTKFDLIEFVPKSISNCFLNLKGLLFFMNIGNQINVDIKGLGDDYSIHEPLISIIVNIISTLQYDGIKPAMMNLENFIDDYLNRRLDVSYYRELTSGGLYRVLGGEFFISNLPKLTDEIDIGYNLYLLRELSSILYEIYISLYRKL
jgi:hypothetical protein